ncbi:MAG TPA: hypothetical protein ENN98_03120 [Desulfurivibrio alkaliphilus]|uniref:Vitamin K epoxide reductase domain-containing protein n=1 Tax=Desulfurivibrio alkaliphilus TaxID=427923 RepID=A0A7C2TJ69_9BACT|nr:hypothetical protein [Desulfurivibrio alkaliphilus]
MIRNFTALLTAMAGMVFSLLSALGLTDGFCVTEGCRLFRGTTFLGIDLYWFGAFFFGVTLLLIGRQLKNQRERFRRHSSSLLLLWLVTGLLVSAFLLGAQALTISCASCLIVAGLLGITAWLLRPDSKALTVILLIWTLTLVAALSGLGRQQFEPVPTFGSGDAEIKLFFSPSCPSCLERLRELARREELHPQLALYPLALRRADLPVILRFHQELATSGSLAAAMETLNWGEPERPTLRELWQIRQISFRNRAFLAGIGARTVPYLLTSTPGALMAPIPDGLGNETTEEGCETDQQEEICEGEETPPPAFNLELLRSLP